MEGILLCVSNAHSQMWIVLELSIPLLPTDPQFPVFPSLYLASCLFASLEPCILWPQKFLQHFPVKSALPSVQAVASPGHSMRGETPVSSAIESLWCSNVSIVENRFHHGWGHAGSTNRWPQEAVLTILAMYSSYFYPIIFCFLNCGFIPINQLGIPRVVHSLQTIFFLIVSLLGGCGDCIKHLETDIHLFCSFSKCTALGIKGKSCLSSCCLYYVFKINPFRHSADFPFSSALLLPGWAQCAWDIMEGHGSEFGEQRETLSMVAHTVYSHGSSDGELWVKWVMMRSLQLGRELSSLLRAQLLATSLKKWWKAQPK